MLGINRRTLQGYVLLGYQFHTEINIIKINHHQLVLDGPVLASSSSLFKVLPSRLFLNLGERVLRGSDQSLYFIKSSSRRAVNISDIKTSFLSLRIKDRCR
jgi:hypothetical protein